MADDNVNVLSQKIYDDTVTLVGGKVYTGEIVSFKRGGFVVRIISNDPAGDIVITPTLESWDKDLGWIPESRAVFDNPPDGTPKKTSDTFINTQSDKYRVGLEPTAGTSGPVRVAYSTQTEE
jgi:hypothetical protein